MKKMTALLLALGLLLGCAGCAPKENEPSAHVLAVSDAMDGLDGILTDIAAAADEMAEVSGMMSGYYTDEETVVSQSMVDGYEQACEISAGRLSDALSRIDALEKPLAKPSSKPSAEEQALYDAADELFRQTRLAAGDMQEVLTFYEAQYDAAAPLVEALNGSAADEVSYLNNCYSAMSRTQKAYRALDVPACLHDNWGRYADAIDGFLKCLQSQYTALTNGDVLMQYSAINILTRLNIVLSNYDEINFSRMQSQYEHTASLMRGRLAAGLRQVKDACGGAALPADFLPDGDIHFDYDLTDDIYPNLYNAMDSAVNIAAWTDGGEREIFIHCEIVGFTQAYEQKMTIGQTVTSLQIKPPILASIPDLSSGRDTQLTLRITDAKTGDVYVQESKSIHINSIYDFRLVNDEFGAVGYDDMLAWLQPESDEVRSLRRVAIEWLGQKYGEGYDMLPGYQGSYGFSSGDANITATQLVALQAAISAIGVRYNNGSYSISSNAVQRVLLPADVLNSGSGICIETSLLMASAVMSTDMHAMLILTPGHCQVAVETWDGSGEYFLVETTCLPYGGSDEEFSSFLSWPDAEGWYNYLSSAAERGNMYVLDCDLLNVLGFQGINYDSGLPAFSMPDLSYVGADAAAADETESE